MIPLKILSNLNLAFLECMQQKKKLPNGKGRSPINWALINGSKKLHANIIKYDDDVDNGFIYSSCILDINLKDNIHTIQQRLSLIFAIEAIKIILEAKSGKISLVDQNQTIDNYFYPKRTEKMD